MAKQTLTVLGATGSIGVNTLDVVSRHPDRFEVFALTGFSQIDRLAEQCRQFRPKIAVVANEPDAAALRAMLGSTGDIEVLHGSLALERVASAAEVTTVMAAIVGAAGLRPSIAAASAGKRVLLANKEALVMAGEVFMSALRGSGATLLPIDSEHNAIFQSLPGSFDYGLNRCGVRKVRLTASGGPFRNMPFDQLRDVTPEQACAHPNWVMGRKISVDSATMMNKGLEVIEASWIFGVPADRIEVMIHPESVIHSMVEYADGSVVAQLGNPDMRIPIAHALAYPDRIDSGAEPLDLARVGKLTFERADFSRFPSLRLAYAALHAGGDAAATLNAANEEAVAAFLERRLGFDEIATIVERVIDLTPVRPVKDIDAVLAADQRSRHAARELIQKAGSRA